MYFSTTCTTSNTKGITEMESLDSANSSSTTTVKAEPETSQNVSQQEDYKQLSHNSKYSPII